MTTPDKRAALEAEISALEAKLALAPAIPPTASITASTNASTATLSSAVSVPAPFVPVANRQTQRLGAVPAPMFANSPGVMRRAPINAPPAAAPAVAAPAAAAPAVAASAPAASRQRPIVLPRAAPGQLPRIGAAPTIHGMPKPAQARATVGSSYMRPRPKRTST